VYYNEETDVKADNTSWADIINSEEIKGAIDLLSELSDAELQSLNILNPE